MFVLRMQKEVVIKEAGGACERLAPLKGAMTPRLTTRRCAVRRLIKAPLSRTLARGGRRLDGGRCAKKKRARFVAIIEEYTSCLGVYPSRNFFPLFNSYS